MSLSIQEREVREISRLATQVLGSPSAEAEFAQRAHAIVERLVSLYENQANEHRIELANIQSELDEAEKKEDEARGALRRERERSEWLAKRLKAHEDKAPSQSPEASNGN